MQDLDQNIDDLFRKAAENYPLRIREQSWEDISSVHRGHSDLTQTTVSPKNKYSGIYICCFLLFVSLLLVDGTNLIHQNDDKGMPVNESVMGPDRGFPTNNKANYQESIAGNEKTSQIGRHPEARKNNPPDLAHEASVQREIHTSGIKTRKNQPIKEGPFRLQAVPVLESMEIPNNPSAINAGTAADSFLTRSGLQLKGSLKAKIVVPKNNATHFTGFYYGVVIGPLFDEIKNQGLKKTGFSIGLITGFKFKNQLTAETGILFANKPYASAGKYFQTDKMDDPMPSGMQIVSLEGNNFVLEIPLKAKLDFLINKKSNFFSAAGVTSYVLTHEKNDYILLMNGSQQSMLGTYKNKSRSLAATIDFSAGYEHHLGKAIRLRFEPYVQIPLKGMGVGDMPMISSGLRIGLLKFTN